MLTVALQNIAGCQLRPFLGCACPKNTFCGPQNTLQKWLVVWFCDFQFALQGILVSTEARGLVLGPGTTQKWLPVMPSNSEHQIVTQHRKWDRWQQFGNRWFMSYWCFTFLPIKSHLQFPFTVLPIQNDNGNRIADSKQRFCILNSFVSEGFLVGCSLSAVCYQLKLSLWKVQITSLPVR